MGGNGRLGGNDRFGWDGKTNLHQAVSATLMVMRERKGPEAQRVYSATVEYAFDCALEAGAFWTRTHGTFPRIADVVELVGMAVHLR